MKAALTAAALFAVLSLAACNWSSVAFNGKCKEHCATINVTANESQADIDSAMKRECEGMGRHGTPQMLDRNKTEVGFTCPG